MFKNIILSVVFGIAIIALERWLDANFIINYLIANLLTIIIAILAINATTIGIVLTKIRELMEVSDSMDDFKKTKKEMMFSIKEQLVLILFSMILIIVIKSKTIVDFPKMIDTLNVLLVSCFFYELWILYDTAKSVFVIIDYQNKK